MKAPERKNHRLGRREGIGCDASVVVVFVECHDGREQRAGEGGPGGEGKLKGVRRSARQRVVFSEGTGC